MYCCIFCIDCVTRLYTVAQFKFSVLIHTPLKTNTEVKMYYLCSRKNDFSHTVCHQRSASVNYFFCWQNTVQYMGFSITIYAICFCFCEDSRSQNPYIQTIIRLIFGMIVLFCLTVHLTLVRRRKNLSVRNGHCRISICSPWQCGQGVRIVNDGVGKQFSHSV